MTPNPRRRVIHGVIAPFGNPRRRAPEMSVAADLNSVVVSANLAAASGVNGKLCLLFDG